MIELKVTGKCESCPAIDPVIDKLYGEGTVAAILVTCRNEMLCRHLEKYIANDIAGSDPPKIEELDI